MSTSVPHQTRLLRHTLNALETAYTGAGDDSIEDDHVAIDVLLTFNHDWERHILIQSSMGGGWTYSLWHVSGLDTFTLIKVFDDVDDGWPASSSHYMSACTLVSTWIKNGHYAGMCIDADPAFL